MYVRVYVVPNAKRESITKQDVNVFRIAVREPPAHNEANRRVITLLAREYGVPVTHVRILTGHHSSTKMIVVDV